MGPPLVGIGCLANRGSAFARVRFNCDTGETITRSLTQSGNMGIPYSTNLPPDLRALKEEIEGYARDYGLDFYETIFEVLDAEDLNEVAAYGGFPTRYPHWSFGMSFEQLKKGYD